MTRVVYMSTYILGSEEWLGAPGFVFFDLLALGGGFVFLTVLLPATAVSSCEASTVLEEPLGCSGKMFVGERKIEPRGAADDLPAACVHPWGYMYIYTRIGQRRLSAAPPSTIVA